MSTGDINYLLNDSRINEPMFRYRARKALVKKFGKTEEEANTLLPKTYGNQHKQGLIKKPKEIKPRTYGNRFTQGNLISIKNQALEIANVDGIDAAIDFIIDESSTENAAMNQISQFKTALKDKGVDTTAIDKNEKRLENQEIAVENMDHRREEKLYDDEFFIHPNFSYDNIINRLAIYEKTDNPDTIQFVADMIVAFSARPSELYSLKFVGDKITGHLKSRDNKPLKYAGMYSIPVAKQMLLKLPREFDLREDKNIKKLSLFMQKYKMQPRALRVLGAEYTTRSYKPNERRKIRQLALRHKKLSTSLESYQMPTNIV